MLLAEDPRSSAAASPAPEDLSWAEPALRPLLASDPAEALRELGVDPPANAPRSSLIEAARMLSVVWKDGKVIPKHEFRLHPDDEGLIFGRGVWESTRTFGGRPWLWGSHVDRINRTARLLNLPIDPARIPDEPTVARFVRGLTGMDVVVRLNASAGSFNRPGAVWMTVALPPAQMESIRLQTLASPVPKDQPFLVWKTFQYATRLRIGRQVGHGFDSTLLVDAQGRLLEAAHANLFVRFDAGWATPSAEPGGLLPGTVRAQILRNAPIPVSERDIRAAEISQVREAFVTNSNVGLVPVTRIDDVELPVGRDTQALARWLLPA